MIVPTPFGDGKEFLLRYKDVENIKVLLEEKVPEFEKGKDILSKKILDDVTITLNYLDLASITDINEKKTFLRIMLSSAGYEDTTIEKIDGFRNYRVNEFGKNFH